MKPPSQLDSAKVLYWAWSGDKPFGYMTDGNGAIVADIYGFAVCTMAGLIYRFSCDRNWQVQNDADFPTPQEAMNAVFTQYQDQPIHWNKYDDTDIDALMDGSLKVKFYREVGEQRIIQKIIFHLQQHNCDGMSVQSIAKDTWLLSIQKKDIQIASEIAKRNVDADMLGEAV